jgi:5-methylcytosine-specific restriction endonuclease McrA
MGKMLSKERAPNWQGGITPEHRAIRASYATIKWRKAVFERDNYTCQKCGKHGGELNADHELPFALFPALRFEVLNGRTLCKPCHQNTDTYGRKSSPWLIRNLFNV